MSRVKIIEDRVDLHIEFNKKKINQAMMVILCIRFVLPQYPEPGFEFQKPFLSVWGIFLQTET